MTFNLEPITFIETPFNEKFVIPRQPRLVPDALGTLEFDNNLFPPESFDLLDTFSHIWLIWIFNEVNNWSPKIKPPRLGGNKKVGVFASRSPFRKNNIGLSLVRLKKVDFKKGKTVLTVAGVDLLNKTPILDIKPYLPSSDSAEEANGGWTDENPFKEINEISFDPAALEKLKKHPKNTNDHLVRLIEQLLRLDPRPAYKKQSLDVFGFNLYDLDIQFKQSNNGLKVISIKQSKM